MRGLISSRVMAGNAFVIFGIATIASLVAAQPQQPNREQGKPGVKVLIVGGGTSHDFIQDYKDIDAKTLTTAGIAAQYTQEFAGVPAQLAEADVLIQASNQTPEPDANMRDAIMHFINAGGGLIAVHAGTWYNWAGWPEYNRLLIGGGTRGHDKLGEFEVTVVRPEHPVMQGVPAHFQAFDELYHQQMDPSGSPVEVLATATSPITGTTYPSVWIVKGQPGRIVCLTLGHDERVHDSPVYRRILVNAVQWTAKK